MDLLPRLGAVLEHSIDGVLLVDRAGTVVYASRSAAGHLGQAGGGLVGRQVVDLVHPDDRQGFEAASRRVEGPPSPQARTRVRDAAGGWRLVEIRGHDLLDEPSVAALVLFVRDVTDQVARERVLRLSEQRYRRMVEEAGDIIFQCDTEGFFTFVNRPASTILKYAEGELIGRHFTELVREDHRAPLVALYLHQRDERVPDTYVEFPALARDGTEVWFGQHVQVMLDDDRVVGLQALARDMTERRQLDEALHQAQRLEAIGTLAGGVAHDFNNLLQAIRGNAEIAMIRLGGQGPEAELSSILDASDRAESLVRQLLAFGRRQTMEPTALDVAEHVAGVCRTWGSALGQGVELVAHCAEGVRPVRFDPVQFEQVLVNLMLNARDAMPSGGRITIAAEDTTMTPALRAQLRTEIADRPFVRISVIDTGEGMPEETLHRVFEPFFTTKDQGKGTGLGLSSAYGIVTQGGGHIGVESRPGEGTRFDVYLPAIVEPARPS